MRKTLELQKNKNVWPTLNLMWLEINRQDKWWLEPDLIDTNFFTRAKLYSLFLLRNFQFLRLFMP